MPLLNSKKSAQMKQIYMTFLFLLCFISCSFSQEQVNKNILDFNWNMDRLSPFYQIITDSPSYPNTFILVPGWTSGSISTLLPLFQARNSHLEISIRLHYKTENLNELYFKLVAFGECERVLSVDTLHIPFSDNWIDFSRSITVENAMFLELFINASADSLRMMETSYISGVLIKEFNVLVDGKQINLNAVPKARTPLSRSDVIPFDSSDVSNLPFMDKKILAIGETVHGTETFNQRAADIIKERILRHNCRLVLLEMPIEISFYINRYIAGDSNFSREYIIDYFDNLLVCSTIFVSLIEWIKEFSQHSEDRVYFFGMDVWPDERIRYLDLFDFFYAINKSENDETLTEMAILLLGESSSIEDVISLFDANQGFDNSLTKGESALVRHALILLYNRLSTPELRDRTMYKNIQFLMGNFLPPGGTVTIFSHLAHANYRSLLMRMTYMEEMPFGYYMRRKHQEDYSCIALITDRGSTLSSNLRSGFVITEMQSSPIGSIEHLMSRLNMDAYISMDKFTCSDALTIKFIGLLHVGQFHFMFPKTRMDGAIFVRKVSAIQRKEEIMNRGIPPFWLLWERQRQARLKAGLNAPEPFF
jgi:erythromycin esterase-like protein